MFYRTDDPVADWNHYCEDQEKYKNRLPLCGYCGDLINDDYYEIEGTIICDRCLNSCRRSVEDSIYD